MIVNLLRNTVQILGPKKLGIPIKSVRTNSIRTSLLNLNNKADSYITKQGRWRSNAFLCYIRNYVDNFGGDASALIARLDNKFISLLHKWGKNPKNTDDSETKGSLHSPTQNGLSIKSKKVFSLMNPFFSTKWFFLRSRLCSFNTFGLMWIIWFVSMTIVSLWRNHLWCSSGYHNVLSA